MKILNVNIILQVVLTILLFSLWAGFALLVVNPNFHQDLPGYKIGQLCIWELVALVVCGIIARMIYKKWKGIVIKKEGDRKVLSINVNYGYCLLAYLILAIIVGIWQFWLFSQHF